jgi:hypothetical protein
MDGQTFLIVLTFFSLAIIGAKKSWAWFDGDDKVKKAGQNWLIRLLTGK